MTFHDESGNVIDYGNRWDGSPPEDAYSRTSNLERYAPLHTVAEALIAHLCAEYQAEVVETTSPEGERTVELVPANSDGAPIKLRFTDFPGIEVFVGESGWMRPSCGCDACDETWEESADDMERFVLGAVEDGHTAIGGLSAPRIWRPWLRPADG